jgi:tetratricopeptide (TPR) repeat protein
MSDEYPRFLTVAVGAQVPYDPTFTEEVQKAAHLVSEAFSAFRGSVEILGDDSTAHRTAMETWLGEWGGHPQRGEIIYWTGHGRSDGDTDYYLGLGNSTYLDETDSLSHDYLAKALRRHQDARKSAATEVDGASWLVLVVDACDSYVGVPLLARKFPIEDQPDNLLILSTGVRAGEVFAGAFAVKLASKLKEVTGNQAKGISVNELFLDRMGADVVPAGHIRTSNAVLVPRHAEPLAGTLEAIRSLEEYLGAASPELRNHFYAKARGAEQNEPGWYFVGRSEERATVANWLDEAPSGMLIITGDPGTGKSALIGRVLLSMDPVLEDRLIANRLLVEERHLRPQWPGVEAVIHLRGARLEDTVRAITTAFKMKTDRPKRVAARIAAKAASLGPRTIVVDALDEAADPAGIAAFLTDVASRPGVRVIVGTRARAAHPEAVDLMDALGTASAETVTLQHSTELDRRRYTYWRLSRSGLTLGSVNRLATEIARKFDSLLVIRMVLAEIAADPTLTADPYEALAVLRGGADQVYQHMLQRIAAAKPASALALRALAFAHGMGIPRDNRVWETAATTLGRLEDRPTRVNDDDLSWVLQHLPAYVLEDSAEGSAVYRLAHQTLTDYLLTGAPSDLADRLDRELASALLGLTPYSVYLAAESMSVVGPEHPDTLTAQANLAASYRQAGRTTDAITILEKVAADRVRILGPEHPDTLTAQANLAASYWQAGRTTDAITILETVAADRVRILGPEHPGTLTAQANLAASYRQAGRATDAITIEEKVAAETVRILGPEHPDTLTAQANLAASYRQAGRTTDAITIEEKVAAETVRILGPEHPDTKRAAEAVERWADSDRRRHASGE